ncbi:low affinity immunoglobulin gamma Fc region receptor II-a-like isoform X1 [Girardinichthys multiradiatus]|uniref:low affinity immunoglobulin gamma Fc region receptor II-a-like isoform X1 n=2 Tax=Girardinichthys multiradiatus TaxID=208333 RepID=UPI001FABBC2F|nr:low affinity immunoglobulin gamma Fc region receptor II-a-like isoform X1 [Girardinichthys multiradiatus]
MDFTSLCTVVAVVRILSNKSQFFLHDSVKLSCVDNKNSSDWRIMRNTTNIKNNECSSTWGKRNGSNCLIDAVYLFDSGQYWCESGTGACSEVINVTVTDGPVILENPALPVAEGEAVILRCIHNKASSFNLTQFYKDGLLIGSSSTGTVTIRDVSRSDEGLYKCNITGAGESPESWLSVRGSKPDSFHFHPTHLLLPVVAVCLLFASAMLLYLWRNLKAKVDDDVSYTDVTFPQKLPKTNAEIPSEPTLYSTIKPGAC